MTPVEKFNPVVAQQGVDQAAVVNANPCLATDDFSPDLSAFLAAVSEDGTRLETVIRDLYFSRSCTELLVGGQDVKRLLGWEFFASMFFQKGFEEGSFQDALDLVKQDCSLAAQNITIWCRKKSASLSFELPQIFRSRDGLTVRFAFVDESMPPYTAVCEAMQFRLDLDGGRHSVIDNNLGKEWCSDNLLRRVCIPDDRKVAFPEDIFAYFMRGYNIDEHALEVEQSISGYSDELQAVQSRLFLNQLGREPTDSLKEIDPTKGFWHACASFLEQHSHKELEHVLTVVGIACTTREASGSLKVSRRVHLDKTVLSFSEVSSGRICDFEVPFNLQESLTAFRYISDIEHILKALISSLSQVKRPHLQTERPSLKEEPLLTRLLLSTLEPSLLKDALKEAIQRNSSEIREALKLFGLTLPEGFNRIETLIKELLSHNTYKEVGKELLLDLKGHVAFRAGYVTEFSDGHRLVADLLEHVTEDQVKRWLERSHESTKTLMWLEVCKSSRWAKLVAASNNKAACSTWLEGLPRATQAERKRYFTLSKAGVIPPSFETDLQIRIVRSFPEEEQPKAHMGALERAKKTPTEIILDQGEGDLVPDDLAENICKLFRSREKNRAVWEKIFYNSPWLSTTSTLILLEDLPFFEQLFVDKSFITSALSVWIGLLARDRKCDPTQRYRTLAYGWLNALTDEAERKPLIDKLLGLCAAADKVESTRLACQAVDSVGDPENLANLTDFFQVAISEQVQAVSESTLLRLLPLLTRRAAETTLLRLLPFIMGSRFTDFALSTFSFHPSIDIQEALWPAAREAVGKNSAADTVIKTLIMHSSNLGILLEIFEHNHKTLLPAHALAYKRFLFACIASKDPSNHRRALTLDMEISEEVAKKIETQVPDYRDLRLELFVCIMQYHGWSDITKRFFASILSSVFPNPGKDTISATFYQPAMTARFYSQALTGKPVDSDSLVGSVIAVPVSTEGRPLIETWPFSSAVSRWVEICMARAIAAKSPEEEVHLFNFAIQQIRNLVEYHPITEVSYQIVHAFVAAIPEKSPLYEAHQACVLSLLQKVRAKSCFSQARIAGLLRAIGQDEDDVGTRRYLSELNNFRLYAIEEKIKEVNANNALTLLTEQMKAIISSQLQGPIDPANHFQLLVKTLLDAIRKHPMVLSGHVKDLLTAIVLPNSLFLGHDEGDPGRRQAIRLQGEYLHAMHSIYKEMVRQSPETSYEGSKSTRRLAGNCLRYMVDLLITGNRAKLTEDNYISYITRLQLLIDHHSAPDPVPPSHIPWFESVPGNFLALPLLVPTFEKIARLALFCPKEPEYRPKRVALVRSLIKALLSHETTQYKKSYEQLTGTIFNIIFDSDVFDELDDQDVAMLIKQLYRNQIRDLCKAEEAKVHPLSYNQPYSKKNFRLLYLICVHSLDQASCLYAFMTMTNLVCTSNYGDDQETFAQHVRALLHLLQKLPELNVFDLESHVLSLLDKIRTNPVLMHDWLLYILTVDSEDIFLPDRCRKTMGYLSEDILTKFTPQQLETFELFKQKLAQVELRDQVEPIAEQLAQLALVNDVEEGLGEIE